ncbi:MAG: RNA polymerase sigma factor [Acidobacteria bacterium]|nr:RNA polymerase sigma factor [Acidobacteriota bacterium]
MCDCQAHLRICSSPAGDGRGQRMSDAFAGMVERQAALMYRVAYSLLRNTHDAEDAVQECLLKLYRLGGWQDAVDEQAFVVRAMWRSAIDRLPQRSFVEATDEVLPAHHGLNPELQAVKSSNEERLHRMIDALPLELRQPLLLSGFEDLTSGQIARIMEIPEGTVRTRLKRAREELKRRWYAAEERTYR